MNSSPLKTVLTLLLALLCLTACLPKLDPGPPPAKIRLAPKFPGVYAGKPIKRQIVVSLPNVAGDLDNDRIALVFHEREVRYLGGLRWAGNLAPMLQDYCIAALESTQALAGVGDEMTGLSARTRLLTDVRQFGLAYDSETALPSARFTATFRLLHLSDARIAATRTVDISVPAASRDNPALVEAMEKALQEGLAEMTGWVIENMR
jgi:ABC-type uncharacterized transport system auxiliary subunit